MAAATTLTPTSATTAEKLIKKPSMNDTKSPTTPTQTSFGCQHVKNLLSAARDKATDQYSKIIQTIKSNVSGQIYKSGENAHMTGEAAYLCLQCTNVTKSRVRHKKDHIFSVESKNGFIFCHDCNDFVYDSTFESIRSSTLNPRKRKHASILDPDDKRLVANNSTITSCAVTGLRGMYNMGQTCFMSVILQSLVHNPFIRNFYMSEGHKKEECEREACTACAMDDIFTDLFGQEKHEGYGAVHMLQGCWKEGGSLAGYSQQDAHEFLGFILNSLHAAITDDDESGGRSNQKDAKHCPCIIHTTFSGLLKSTVTCSKCDNTTTALDPFLDLSLDIRSAPTTKKKKLTLINGTSTTKEYLPMDLNECLDRFTSTETLSAEAGSYNCRACSSPQEAKKKFSLSRLPPVVPVHLKRFEHSKLSSQSSKIETRIRFPTSLDLGPYCTTPLRPSARSSSPDPEELNGTAATNNADAAPEDAPPRPPKPVYELSSVIVHKGKIDNGHYISYSRQGREWFRFDDSMVVQVEEKEVLGAEAYMLFYVVRELEG